MALRIAAAQLNVVVGDLDGNVARILEALRRAEGAGAAVCIFPELAVTGYPPEDLLLKPGFVADNVAALDAVARTTATCVAVVGFVQPLDPASPPPTGPDADGVAGAGGMDAHGFGAEARSGTWPSARVRLANAAAVCANGAVVGVYRKRLLPNYSVFDEQRWFTPASGPPVLYRVGGALMGVSICEDVWEDGGPVAALGRAGAQLVVNLNGSPYSRGRRAERLAMLRDRVHEAGSAIAYVNQVGGQDELVFDGASLVLGRDGTLLGAGAQFAEDLVVVDVPLGSGLPCSAEVVEVDGPVALAPAVAAPPPEPLPSPRVTSHVPDALDPVAEVYAALVLGTRDYLGKNGFGGAVIALSGGVDSALVATIATDALGPSAVRGVGMPSRYSSQGSVTDARELARRLGIAFEVVPIDEAHTCMANVLQPVLGGLPSGVTDENLQSRLRGVILMAISNATGWIVLATGNKSEMATGYSTLYGDSVGGFAVIKDVPKTLVYELCRSRNARAAAAGQAPPIPESILDKPPSAELRPDQRDDQSLPPYELLDPILEAYVERDRTGADLVAEGFDPALVDRVVRLVDGAEYKRRQMAPGVRITNKAFGRDRRVPITNGYRRRFTELPAEARSASAEAAGVEAAGVEAAGVEAAVDGDASLRVGGE
jgi:NAD+ synthase (glutamine-hydrolysing)